jgi:hypothetical protein
MESPRLGGLARLTWCVVASLCGAPTFAADAVVPGTGQKIAQVGDDFEDEQWEWVHHWPKSSEDLNRSQNAPGGEASNSRWYEGIKRGHPDLVQRVATPPGGLPDSRGSLLLRSLHTGVPRSPSFRQQQDDFVADVQYRLGGAIPVHQTPSVVTRVFLPPIAQWERRAGCQFAFRCSADTSVRRTSLARSRTESETYYPGFFLDFEPAGQDHETDSALWRIRANSSGDDFPGKQITTTGWWTLGMSFTADGAVHYYARPGVGDLQASDHITTQVPYGYRCERFRTFFFNVCNGDDGRTWSTEWVVDDPSVYYIATR